MLLNIARSQHRSRGRRLERERRIATAESGAWLSIDGLSAERLDVLRAVQQLSPTQRALLFCIHWDGTSVAEAAAHSVDRPKPCPSVVNRASAERGLAGIRRVHTPRQPNSTGAVVGVEVKASERVEGKHLTGLRRLRDRLGSAFVAGLAFHLGPVGYEAEDRIHSLPIERLWR